MAAAAFANAEGGPPLVSVGIGQQGGPSPPLPLLVPFSSHAPASSFHPSPYAHASHHCHHHYVNPLVSSFPSLIGPRLPCKYRARRVIGCGAYSTVWELVDNATGARVVGKLAELDSMANSDQIFARTEAVNIQTCQHPNIIALYASYEDERTNRLLHVLEYAEGGDLLAQVTVRSAQSEGPAHYSEADVLVIFSQLCLAVKCMHDHQVLHRDLKTPNVMLMPNGLIKLGDFGFSRQYEESVLTEVGRTLCGTPFYLAPEVWCRQPYSSKADMWSLGVVLYELLALKKPFHAKEINELMHRALQPRSYEPLASTLKYSEELRALVDNLLSIDPNERPSVDTVLCTPLLQTRGLPLLRDRIGRLKRVEPGVRAQLLTEIADLMKRGTATEGKA